MELNTTVLDTLQQSETQLLLVTKYLDKSDTFEVIEYIAQNYNDTVVGFGENRVQSLKDKDLPRDLCHFIGNIQTKEIKYITKHCSVVHSVSNIKHLKKMEYICGKQGNWIQVFLQINIDPDKPGGISPEEIPEFLELVGDMENVSLIGFSAIGKLHVSPEEKKAEFQLLKDLRQKYIQNGYISMGTSIDYQEAIDMGIDVVRVGSAIYNNMNNAK